MDNKKVLVVDDDVVSRLAIKEQLELKGFEVQVAENGIQALEEYKKSPCDLALVDIIMPGMDGLGLLVKLKEINQNLPVIMLTGDEKSESRERAKELGAYEYITKPVYISKLKQMIDSALSLKE